MSVSGQESRALNYVVDCQSGASDTSTQDSQEDTASSYVTVSELASEILSAPENVESVVGEESGDVTISSTPILNPEAESFVILDQQRIHPSRHGVSLQDDVRHVQQVQAGGVGAQAISDVSVWNSEAVPGRKSGVELLTGMPFYGEDSIPDIIGIAPKQVQKVKFLLDLEVKLPVGNFTDKVLPAPRHSLDINCVFTPDYFVALHQITAAPGYRPDGTPYLANTPNHIGARVALPHTKLKLDRWRYHLLGYEHAELAQYLQFGFPLGLIESAKLECQTRNHGSAYMWFDWVDKFIATEIMEGGMTGPFKLSPLREITVSPLMTAHKKPQDRRTVYDATYGEGSVNSATPGDTYMGQPINFTYPRVEDYRVMILKAGRGKWMWKRDLKRFFLQLPLDPVEYNKVAVVWRGLFFVFVCLAFGLRHSGLNGQRVSDAVSWILRNLGLETVMQKLFNVCNYVDDFGGVEATEERAKAAFDALATLLDDLGLQESKKKAVPPTICNRNKNYY